MTKEPTTKPVPEDDNGPATKEDIRSAVDKLAQITAQGFAANKNDLTTLDDKLEQRFTKIENLIRQESNDTRALVEEVREDVGRANADEVSLITNQKLPELDERITALERRAEVA